MLLAGYYLLFKPLELAWNRYATRLAAGLEKVHD
jgi:hypothetical protein